MPIEGDPAGTDSAHATRMLQALLGRWRGTGEGAFPGIEPFRYREELEFRTREGEDTLLYEQQAWIRGDENAEEASHWEAGFLLVTEDGRVDLLNAQNSGRVEVLRGDVRTDADGTLELVLESLVHGHDPRMVSTRRRFRVRGDEMIYEVDMATRKTDRRLRHLEARLTRRP